MTVGVQVGIQEDSDEDDFQEEEEDQEDGDGYFDISDDEEQQQQQPTETNSYTKDNDNRAHDSYHLPSHRKMYARGSPLESPQRKSSRGPDRSRIVRGQVQ